MAQGGLIKRLVSDWPSGECRVNKQDSDNQEMGASDWLEYGLSGLLRK